VWAVAAVFRRPKTAADARRRFAPDAAVLGTALREIAEVTRQQQAQGWTSDLAARALTPLRIAAAYAAGRPVAQVPAGGSTTAAPGQLRVTSWLPRRRTMLVSASATAESLGAGAGLSAFAKATADPPKREREGGQTGPEPEAGLVDLHAAMATFTAAAYGRDAKAVSDRDLDEALERGRRGVRHVARRFTAMARAARAARRSASGALDRAWAR
jgi:hypothetical protein